MNDLQNKLIWELYSRHSQAVILITAVMAATISQLNIKSLHGGVVMSVIAMMASHGLAVMGVMALMVFAWGMTIFVFVF